MSVEKNTENSKSSEKKQDKLSSATLPSEQVVYSISLDFETTGLSDDANICQIGMDVQRVVFCKESKLVVEWEPVFKYNKKVKPRCKMTPGARHITGISDEMLEDCDDIGKVFRHLVEKLNNKCPTHPRIFAAYNGFRFDFKILFNDLSSFFESGEKAEKMVQQLKMDMMFDPLELAKLCLKHDGMIHNRNGKCSFKLGDVYKSLMKRELQGAHDALADCSAVSELMQHDSFDHYFSRIVSSVLSQDNIQKSETKFIKNPVEYFNTLSQNKKTRSANLSLKSHLGKYLKNIARPENLKRKMEKTDILLENLVQNNHLPLKTQKLE